MVAGAAPDLDGVGLVVDLATRRSETPTDLWAAWHHVVGHGLTAALVCTALTAVATRRVLPALLVAASFHLHVLGDLVGARGPDGDQWPIRYLWPVSDLELTWSGQWALNAWPNFAITGALLAMTLVVWWRAGRSPLEVFAPRAHAAVTSTLRARFGAPAAARADG